MLIEIASWNVVFLRAPRTSWWDWLTEERWRHVCAFGYSVEAGAWVIIDPADTSTRIVVTSEDGLDAWLDQRAGYITSILRMPVQENCGLVGRLGFWCVPAVKHLLGFRSGAFRPSALYRDLVNAGAEKAFVYDHGRSKSKTPAGRSGNESAP